MLSALQERVARILRSLPEAEGFALAGGAALILRGEVERGSEDLDYFATAPAEVGRLAPALEAALQEAGLAVRRVREHEGFVRLEVTDGAEVTGVDLGYDFRLRPAEASAVGPVLSGEELAADKVLALDGRAFARDLLDVAALARRFGPGRLLELAAEKDLGFDTQRFAEALGAAARRPRADFDADDAMHAAVVGFAARWRAELARGSPEPGAPEQREPPGPAPERKGPGSGR